MTNIKYLLFAFVYATTVLAQPSSAKLDKLLADDFFQRATIGVAVYDLTEQKMLYVHNEKRLCRPASTMKLLTSAAALTMLTSRYSFKTGLYHTGEIDESGVLAGDIYLVGGFDPELKSSDLDDLISQMKKAGITNINGNLYLDSTMADSVHWGKAWSWDDDMEAFQPYLSPIPLNKGLVRLRITPTTPDNAPTITTDPESSFIQIVNRATTVRKSAELPQTTLQFNREFVDDHNSIVVSGVIAVSANPFERAISLKNPYGYVMTIFLEKMSNQFPESNINAAGTKRLPEEAQIIGFASNSIMEAVRRSNKNSDNLSAEMLLYTLGYDKNNEPATIEKGITRLQKFISQTGHDPKLYRIVDGSGLSNQNSLSPELLVDVLKFMHQSPHFDLFLQSMSIAGVDGTMAGRMRNTAAHRKVRAKTGSLTGVCTLAGYVTASNGNMLAFSILIQNFVERASFVAVNYIDKICIVLAE